jgi:signal peptidase I
MPTQIRRRGPGDDRDDLATSRAARHRAKLFVLVPLLLALVFILFGFTTNLIPSRSMEPNLLPGDHVVIMRGWLAYPFGTMPARGDIITFHPPKAAQTDENSDPGAPDTANAADQPPSSLVSLPRQPKREILIKRVIGLPGDTVQIVNGMVYVNGKRLQEDYKIQPLMDADGLYMPYAVRKPLKVEPGHLFVLGDNRNNSDDGRFWGTLDRKEVIGKCVRVLFHEKAIEQEVDAEPGPNGR